MPRIGRYTAGTSKPFSWRSNQSSRNKQPSEQADLLRNRARISGYRRKDDGNELDCVLIPLSDIKFINVKRTSAAATTVLVVGLSAAVTLGVIYVNLSTLIGLIVPDS